MGKRKNYTFYLFGQDSLAIACAEFLLNENFILLGVISSNETIRNWAIAKKLNYFENLKSFLQEKDIKKLKVDYIFSIQNEIILPDHILKLPKILAINYHNAPLPKYAGLNGTSWAIINNEQLYGVTWHVMTNTIDAGDILIQKFFEITYNETRASLDIKCIDAARASFIELIEAILRNSFKKTKQDASQRTYYSSNDFPPNRAFIKWNDTAEEIDRLCRALIFVDHHDNTFGLAKIIIKNRILCITDFEMHAESSNTKAGTVVNLQNGSLQVATLTKDIIIKNLSELNGKPIKISELVDNKIFYKGMILESYTAGLPEFINIRNEKYWVNKFLELYPSHNYITNRSNIKRPRFVTKQINIEKKLIKKCLIKLEEKNSNYLLMSVILIYLYKTNNYENFSIATVINLNSIRPNFVKNYLSNIIPFNLKLNPDDTIKTILNSINTEYQQLAKFQTFTKDIFFRYTKLKNYPQIFPLFDLTNASKDRKNSFKQPLLITLNESLNNIILSYDINYWSSEDILLIEKIEESVFQILKELSQNIRSSIKQISIITKNEKQKIKNIFNSATTKYPRNISITSLFEKIYKIYPNHIALRYQDETLTYKQLRAKAKKLSLLLLKLRHQSVVGILTDNSLDSVVSMLAILYSGNIYLPLNTSYPKKIIKNILVDSDAKCILVNSSTASEAQKYFNFSDTYLININEDYEGRISAKPIKHGPKSIAYLMYTSGSMGSPKGVLIEHRAVIRLIKNTNYVKIKASDNILQAANLAFDASTFEIWGALLNGASLTIYNTNNLLDPLAFKKFILKENISIMWLTSGLFDKYALAVPAAFRKLKYLIIGGDVVNPNSVRYIQLCKQGKPKFILNGYGPTENTTFTTTYNIPNLKSNITSIPIGKPLSNTQVYIVDKYFNLMPIGIAGELYVTGDGLAKGYLNNSQLNKQFFLRRKIDNKIIRFYKTGDSVRWLKDGNIEYLGRLDNQVKIRGFRVELDAIKRCLIDNCNVTDCVVVVNTDLNNKKYIAAYFVAKKDSEKINGDAFKSKLLELLPDFMIPSYFIKIDTIPINANGKVDRTKLPIPTPQFGMSAYIEPETDIQKKLVRIWSKILNNQHIGIKDSFFELGGDSLLIAELSVKLREVFNVGLSLTNFFHNPTIQNLENYINDHSEQSNSLPNLIIQDLDINWLPKIIYSKIISSPYLAKNILLTGATGFLGTNLLVQLLKDKNNKIFCLIRAKSIELAKIKLKQALIEYIGTNDLVDLSKVEYLLGDLSEPRLGLSMNDFSKLSNEIDEIYHNAAYVHHLLDYSSLRNTNVLSTLDLINLASLNKPKTIIYISTLSVASKNQQRSLLIEEVETNKSKGSTLVNGYEQTKWVSEWLLFQARQRGIKTFIFRPAWILGDRKTGICIYRNNHLMLLLKGCIQLGCAPNWEMKINIVPVNTLSNAIVKIVSEHNSEKFIFNFSNPNSPTWKQVIQWLNHFGYKVELVNQCDWKQHFISKLDINNAAYKIMPIYLSNNNKQATSYDPVLVCNDNMINALHRLNLELPIIDMDYFRAHIEYLEKVGFLSNLQHLEKNLQLLQPEKILDSII